ncbi:MAG: Hsp20/alpha crystallin family protein [Kiritimatiellae bacterium]|nr:Hsp20/alpha crystallin family protein [Kiritimatiellia bacterium]
METKSLSRFWRWCDGVLLVAVFALLGWSLWRDSRSVPSEPPPPPPAMEEPEAMPEPPPPPSRSRVVDGIRVGTRQMPQIARSLSSGWEKRDGAPALDIRERDRTYEIAISLPDGIDRESVRIATAGHVLTLGMATRTGTLKRRILLPCEITRESQVTHLLTNGILRIRVTPETGPHGR